MTQIECSYLAEMWAYIWLTRNSTKRLTRRRLTNDLISRSHFDSDSWLEVEVKRSCYLAYTSTRRRRVRPKACQGRTWNRWLCWIGKRRRCTRQRWQPRWQSLWECCRRIWLRRQRGGHRRSERVCLSKRACCSRRRSPSRLYCPNRTSRTWLGRIECQIDLLNVIIIGFNSLVNSF